MDSITDSLPRRFGYTRLAPLPNGAPERHAELQAQQQTIASAGAVDGWFHDDDVDADQPLAARPALRQLLDALRPGDTFALATIDRIGADPQDLADVLRRTVSAGAAVEVAGAPWRVDLPTVELLVLHAVLSTERRAGRIGPETPTSPTPVDRRTPTR